MSKGEKHPHPRGQAVSLSVFLALCLIFQAFYVINMVQWVSSPEVGFRVSPDLDPHTVFYTTDPGRRAGLLAEDWILSINGITFETHSQRRKLIEREVGSVNYYEVQRDDQKLVISVPVAKKGIRIVLTRSGLPWIIGLVFSGIGVVVFFMKPYTRTSWSFLGMTLLMGLTITYTNPSSLYRPQWLEGMVFLFFTFLPATIIDLAAVFPGEKKILARNPWWRRGPYLFSLILAVLLFLTLWGQSYAYTGKYLRSVQFLYAATALILFLGLNLYSSIRAENRAVRYQALLVLTGFTFALLVPLTVGVIMFTSNLVIIPAKYFLPSISILFILFPLSMGYAIVKHDLFAIDTIIRRTYGYFLSTGTIIGFYAILVSGLNTTFQTTDVSRSPFFSIFFALTVVFTFRPLHERFQRLVDRVFYRQQYDYRGTIRGVSETMVSIFDAGQIQSTLIGTVVEEMFLENGVLFQKRDEGGFFESVFARAEEPGKLEYGNLMDDHPLVLTLAERDAPVYLHEIELDPGLEDIKGPLQDIFRELDSEIMLPLRYKENMVGIVSLGRKKSGKMFTPEDVDLLQTVVNQGAVALENARLFEENLEKGRMEEELKIAHDLQMAMLPEAPPELVGMEVAARCIPAQEVGGDFYDYIQIPGEDGNTQLGIVVADVSGKAVSGALVMAATRSVFRILSGQGVSVSEVMSLANSRLKGDVKKGMFVAMLYAVLDPIKRSLTLANAGQTQPILIKKGPGEPHYLETEGDRFPLGIVDGCSYQETHCTLESGDVVVLYTDGVVEAINGKGEMYGFDHFLEVISGLNNLAPEPMLESILADITNFVGNTLQHDDITIMVVKAS